MHLKGFVYRILKKNSKMWYFLPQHHHTSLQDDESWTPLHSSASRGSSGVVAELVKASCDVDAATSSGATAMHFAASKGHEDILQQLVTAGGDRRDGLRLCQVSEMTH